MFKAVQNAQHYHIVTNASMAHTQQIALSQPAHYAHPTAQPAQQPPQTA
jgi:hypothetical protein